MRRVLLFGGIAFLGTVCLLGATGCSGEGSTAGSGGADLDGRSFVSTSVSGHDLVAGTTIELSFTDGRIAATAGCNQMGGDYHLDGDQLKIDGEMFSTMMGCEPDRQQQDVWLQEFLNDSPTVTRLTTDETSGGMQLSTGDVTIEFADEG